MYIRDSKDMKITCSLMVLTLSSLPRHANTSTAARRVISSIQRLSKHHKCIFTQLIQSIYTGTVVVKISHAGRDVARIYLAVHLGVTKVPLAKKTVQIYSGHLYMTNISLEWSNTGDKE
jgi:hypothetical protein